MSTAMPAPASARDGALPQVDVVALADRCVQCGLCLPACPTYRHDRLEADSPRGRIALAKAWALDTIDPTPVGDAHMDGCLGCRSCEAVCPAGVEYGALLTLARANQRRRRGATSLQRLLEWLAARPALLARLTAAYRLSRPWLPARLRFLPTPPAPAQPRPPEAGSPAPESQAALFVGCIAKGYEAPVRTALSHLCLAVGVELATVPRQTCCGALHAHAGNQEAAERLAVVNRTAFTGHARVLTLASGCHDAVAAQVDGETIDAIEFLQSRSDRLHFADAGGERIALHLPCTQRNVVGSVPALRRLLAAVPGLEVVELDAGFGCCGAAGTAMVTDPGRAAEYRRPLLDQLAASGATRLLSANIGCRLHLANGTTLSVQHPAEFLAERLSPRAHPFPATPEPVT
ncbi:MAG: (Fe-S)-binding protein [Lysobacter spongiicola]|nr:(Fe-S)-binding protein [Lysobacter spongiicola]